MRRLIIAGVVLALIGAACGDDTAATTTGVAAETSSSTMAPITTAAATTTVTAAPPTTVAPTTTTAPATTTTATLTTTTTTLPPPPDPSDWIGVVYSGMAPAGLQLLQAECVGIVNICDYTLSIATLDGVLPELPPFKGPIDFIALLESRDASNDALVVDAATIRGFGTDLVWSECWTTAGDVYVVGVWDRVTGFIAAFRWDVTVENIWVIQGSEIGSCWDPNDNE